MAISINEIEILNLIGESSKFRVYLGQRSDEKVIVKVAKTFEDNQSLADDAKMFNSMKAFETHLQSIVEYSHQKAPGYNLLFADLLSSSMEPTQGDRRINIFTMPDVELDQLMPLTKLSSQMKIDARTSVWILGRFFKLYGMFEIMREAEGADACKYPVFSENDYLISPGAHRLIYYNFSEEICDIYATDIVRRISSYMLSWIDFDDTDENQQFKQLLEDFSKNGRKTSAEAHKDLYDLVRELWGISYYPFTYRINETLEWKVMKEE